MRCLLLLVFVGLVGSSEACLGSTAAYGDYLLWKATSGDLNFAIVGSGGQALVGRQQRLEPSFHSGFRVGAGISLVRPGMDIMVRYLWYHFTERASAYGRQLWGTTGYPSVEPLVNGSSGARMRIRHEMADLEFGQRFCLCALELRLFTGVHYSWVDHKFDVDYLSESAMLTTRRNGEFFGFGPRLGLEGKTPIFCGLNVGGKFALAVLAGGERSRFSSLEEGGDVLDVHDPMKGRLVPLLEGALRLTYEIDLRCVQVTLRFGYEAMIHIQGISRMQFFQTGSGINTHQTTGFGLLGPFCGLAVAF